MEIIRTLICEGIIRTIDKSDIQCPVPFIINQYDDGHLQVEVNLHHNKNSHKIIVLSDSYRRKNKTLYFSLKGRSLDPVGEIDIPTMYIRNSHYEPPNYKLSFEVTYTVDVKFGKYLHRKYELRVAITNLEFHPFSMVIDDVGFEFRKISDYEKIIDKLTDNRFEPKATCEMFVYNRKKCYPDYSEKIESLMRLLSYAVRTNVNSISEEYSYNNKLVRLKLKPARTKKFVRLRYLIDSGFVGHTNLSEFLSSTFPKYLENEEKFGFHLAFDYYLSSFQTNIYQEEFFSAYVCLEVLLDHYELLRKQSGNPIIKGNIQGNKRKIKTIIKQNNGRLKMQTITKIAEKISYSNLTINEKLYAFFQEKYSKNIDFEDRQLSEIRNTIIHTGKIPDEVGKDRQKRKIDIYKEICRLIYLNDRIILRILEYNRKLFHNPYKDYDYDHIDY